MRKSKQFAAVLAGALAFTSLACVSAFAEPRHRDETWRDNQRYERRNDRRDDRDFLRGTVERVDRRRNVVFVRTSHSGRTVAVEMDGRRGNRAGVDLRDLHRGDYVTFVGDWSRGGVFEARRIDSVDSRRGRR